MPIGAYQPPAVQQAPFRFALGMATVRQADYASAPMATAETSATVNVPSTRLLNYFVVVQIAVTVANILDSANVKEMLLARRAGMIALAWVLTHIALVEGLASRMELANARLTLSLGSLSRQIVVHVPMGITLRTAPSSAMLRGLWKRPERGAIVNLATDS